MNRNEIAKHLQAVPLFAGLSKKELLAVAGTAKEVHKSAGEVLAAEGEHGVGFFLIVEGEARVVIRGRTRGRLASGQTFGEIALLDGGPRSATVVAETDMTLLGLPSWDFKALLNEYPSITRKLLEEVAGRLREASASITD